MRIHFSLRGNRKVLRRMHAKLGNSDKRIYTLISVLVERGGIASAALERTGIGLAAGHPVFPHGPKLAPVV